VKFKVEGGARAGFGADSIKRENLGEVISRGGGKGGIGAGGQTRTKKLTSGRWMKCKPLKRGDVGEGVMFELSDSEKNTGK